MRIVIAGFQHETNRSTPFPTTYDDFVLEDGWPGMTEGEDIFDKIRPANLPMGGFLNFAAETGLDVLPIIWTSAEPAGLVQDDAFERISQKILDGIESAGTYDGIYLDLHGAMVSDSFEDCEGELLKRVRNNIGEQIPIAVSLDLHANITKDMTVYSDVITIYRTYPHIDMDDSGYRAGKLLVQMIESGQKPHCEFRKTPFMMPLHTQCTDLEPAKSLYASLPDENSLLLGHADIALGFPPSDIAENGPAIVSYDFSKTSCETLMDTLYEKILADENLFTLPFFSPKEAIEMAKIRYDGVKPVILADIQDSSGAGCLSDTTELLAELSRCSVTNCALGTFFDANAVDLAFKVGIGGEFECRIGDKFSNVEDAGFEGKFRVAELSDGIFKYAGKMMAGLTANIGNTAAIDLLDCESEIRIVVTSTRIQCVDQAILTHIGVDPTNLSLLVLKSSVHFRADFTPICSEIILVEAKGGLLPCRFDYSLFPRLREGVRLL